MARLAYMHQMQFMIMIYIEKNGLKAHKKLPAEKRTLSLGISGYLSMARMVQMYDILFGSMGYKKVQNSTRVGKI